MIADTVVIRYADAKPEVNLRQYLVALSVLAFRYWAKGDAEAQDWTLRVVRGELGKIPLHKCDKCSKLQTDVRDALGIKLCVECIKEFVAAHTMIQRHELPAPTPT